MKLIYAWFFVACLIVDAYHFRGGTITWKPMNNNVTGASHVSIMITQTYVWTKSQIDCNSSMVADQSPPINLGTKAGNGMNLSCNANCSTSGGYLGNEVPITGYCTDFSDALDLTVSQRSDIVNLTIDAYFSVAFSTTGGWQTLALGSSAGWSLSALIDLSPRPDNGLINTPPVATCISYISIPVSVQQSIQIPVLDADNDFLRCRFANGTTECLNTCPPGSLPPGTTLSSSCLLTITGINVNDYYLVAAQVEDFSTSTSVTPLSSIPIQFLVYVYAAPNCTLEPLLISNLDNNQCQAASVGQNFTITFTAVNLCGNERTMSDIATLSFPVITKSALVQNTTNTSLWSMTITWQPTVNELSSQVLCAVASDNASVQSDQYCLRIFVGLNGAALCPGVTLAPTTMITTMETSMDTSTSHQTDSTVTSELTSAFITSTRVSSTKSNENNGNGVNWTLIALLLSFGLLAALCCACFCCHFIVGPAARRRRQRKKVKDMEHSFHWNRSTEKAQADSMKHSNAKGNFSLSRDTSRILSMSSDTSTLSRSLAIRRSQQEKSSAGRRARTAAQEMAAPMVEASAEESENVSHLWTPHSSTATLNRTNLIHVIKLPRSYRAASTCRTSSSAKNPRPTTVTVTRLQRSASSNRQTIVPPE